MADRADDDDRRKTDRRRRMLPLPTEVTQAEAELFQFRPDLLELPTAGALWASMIRAGA